jgi:hypothetical protein
MAKGWSGVGEGGAEQGGGQPVELREPCPQCGYGLGVELIECSILKRQAFLDRQNRVTDQGVGTQNLLIDARNAVV